jgi:hypothetical protein
MEEVLRNRTHRVILHTVSVSFSDIDVKDGDAVGTLCHAAGVSAEHALPPHGNQVDPRRLATWASALAALIALLDAARWQRRAHVLLATSAPYDLKIVDDHYWLEMEWARCWVDLQCRGRLPELLTRRSVAALEFAKAVVATSRALSPAAQRVLVGRLGGGLNSGFADLYQEFSVAAQLRAAGWTVRFADMEGTARHDIDAVRDGLTICIECKTLSAAAGRKVHRRDFYRFATMAQPELSAAPARGAEAVVVRMADRFPTSRPEHVAIIGHIRQCTTADVGQRICGRGYTVHRDVLAPSMLSTPAANGPSLTGVADITKWVRSRYGPNCHVAGHATHGGIRLLVVVSAREDDPSRESLAARTKAAGQLPSDKPGIVSLQYGEIASADLFTDHFKRRLGILDAHFLTGHRAEHVIAVHHSAFDGLERRHGRLVHPAATSARSDQHLAVLGQMFIGQWLAPNVPATV